VRVMENSKNIPREISQELNAPMWKNLTYTGRTITAECLKSDRYANYWLWLYLEYGSKSIQQTSKLNTKVTLNKTLNENTHYTAYLQWILPDKSKKSDTSSPLNVVVNKPQIQNVYFDGEHVFVSWTNKTSVPTGGIITILSDNTPIATKTVKGCSGNVPLTPDRNKSYFVQVTAATGDNFISKGPPSAKADVIIPVYYFFSQTSSSCAYIFRDIISQPGKHDITLYLPDIFSTSPDPSKISENPFILQKTENDTFPYVLQIAEDSIAWQFNSDIIRDNLKNAYLKFLKNLEDSDLCTLKPGALTLVRSIIARGLPLTFAETLYYNYGFNPAKGYINIQPGMQLQIDYENHQTIGIDPQDKYLNGFVGTGSSYHDVGSYLYGTSDNIVKTGFNSFLNLITRYTVDPNKGGAGGIVDVTGNDYRHPYYRLFYPSEFASSDSTGAVGVTKNVALLGADSYSDIETATDIYLKNGNFYGAPGISTFFRGRVVIIPHILCFVQNTPMYVPVGTTIRQVMEKFTSLPMAENVIICDLEYTRSIGNVVDHPTTLNLYSIGCSNAVNFNKPPLQVYTDGKTYFDLPVLHGDSLILEKEGE
jgi:hypothetical protein